MDYKKLDLPNTNYPNQEQLKAFETAFDDFLETNPQENENHQNDAFNDLLKGVFKYKVKPTKKIDSTILNENNEVEVIIEFKALKNPNEFIKKGDLNVKAFHESLLYYLTERKEGNNNLKHLILATIKELYIIDANEFEVFNKDKEIKKAFENCHDKKGNDPHTKAFYDACQKRLNELDRSLKYHHISLKKENLALIYQALSPNFLLKIPKYSDANTLNKDFYEELLYILGLEEQNDKGKILIKPSRTKNSLSDALKGSYNNLDDEEVMALLIAWNNRILFLRLLESLLNSFKHFENPFLTTENFKDFNALNTLFFEVLAKKNSERLKEIKEDKILEKIPYLNSSLFDKTPLELKGYEIKLLNNKPLEIYPKSVLKKHENYQKDKPLPLLEYFFKFLCVYKFTTTPKDIKDNTDTSESRLINPSVLGLVFEKLNGYKEGSFYTPSFITSYMCKESITPIVLDKFNAIYQWDCKDLKALKGKIDRDFSNEKAKEYLQLLLTLRVCDPAVGSGHFLVSALNEMVWVAYELGFISSLYRYDLKLENDEIIIHTPENKIFNYTIPHRENDPHHHIQKELFELKKSIIENCLFGVDINPNSCEITKLRLWIELLKYSYYIFEEGKNTNNLETLPNIDINIKCANSLIFNFPLNSKLTIGQTLEFSKNLKAEIKEYKNSVMLYKEGLGEKTKILQNIAKLKSLIINYFIEQHQAKKHLKESLKAFISEYGDGIFDLSTAFGMEMLKIARLKENNYRFNPTLTKKQPSPIGVEANRLLIKIKECYETLENLKNSKAFEWRFEFPEVLNDEGDFSGFDCIIGNPPYIKEGGNKELFASTKRLRTYQGKMDIWYHFVGIGLEILKQNRVLSFIATNNWTTNAGAEKLRNILLRETQFISLIDFGDYRVFESADIQTMIMCFKKIISPNQYFFDYRKIIAKKPSDTNRITLLQRKECEGNLYLNAKIEKKNLINKTLFFSHFDSIFNTILKNAILFLNKKEITNGIHPHYDRINKKINEKFSNQFFNGEGIFVLSEAEKNNLKLSQKEMKLLKPSYETAEIMKYLTLSQNQHWIIYTDSSFKNPKSMDDYPNLKKHLDRFKEVITSDNKPYGLHRARDERFFTGNPRIIVLRKCAKEPIFSYVNFDCYVSATFYIIKTKRFDSKFLVGLLNSLLIRFWLKHRGKVQGNNYQIDKEPLMNIPLIKITKSNQPTADKIIVLVDKILQIKEKDPKANTQGLEKEIDALVYQLYNLTDEEIKIIEDGQ